MGRKKKQDKNADILQEALKRYSTSQTYDKDQRDKARDDVIFAQVEGEQWDLRYNHDKTRPRYEVNKIQHSINQVVGEYTGNELSIKVRAASSDAEEEMAETYNGLIRNIFNQSSFKKTQTEALKEVCNSGFGAWRVRTDFLDPDSFDQEPLVEWVPDAIGSVWFDPYDKDPLKRNSEYCFIVEDLSPESFEEQYPDAAANSFDNLRERNQMRQLGWLRDDAVRVAEYFRKIKTKKKIVLMSDGATYFYDDVKSVLDEFAQSGITVVKERMTDHFEIEWCKMSGSEILEGPVKWPGKKYIPVIPAYGYHNWIDGRFVFRGMVRFAKDAQRIYNYTTTAKIEAAALSPKDPIFITDEMIEGYEDEYLQFNLRNTPFLRINPTPEGQTPFRLGAPLVQQALIEQANQADMDIQATLGRNSAALGNVPVQPGMTPSGTAINAVQQQSNVGQRELFANLTDAVQHTGAILVDILPNIYDTARQVRILKPDGQTKFVPINQEVQDIQTGEVVLTHDLNQGKYDVEVTLGAAFETQRQETMALLQSITQSYPEVAQLTADLMAKSLDSPVGDEIEVRLRKQMIQGGLIEPNEAEQKEIQEKAQAAAQQPPSPQEQMNMQIQLLQAQALAASVDQSEANILKTQAEANKIMADADKSEVDAATSLMDAVTKQVEAGMTANLDAIKLMKDQISEANKSVTSTLPEQINLAFRNVVPDLYELPSGDVVSVYKEDNTVPLSGTETPAVTGISGPGSIPQGALGKPGGA